MTTDPITGRAIYTPAETDALKEARLVRMEIQERLREIWRKYPSLVLAAIPEYAPEIYHH